MRCTEPADRPGGACAPVRPQQRPARRAGLLFCLLAAALCLCGCGTAPGGRADHPASSQTDSEAKEVSTMTDNNLYSREENRQFLMDQYGFTADQLEGIDLTRFIADYQLRTRDYPAEKVQGFLRRNRDIYQDDGTTELYALLDTAEEGGLPEGAAVQRIGYYRNVGALRQRMVFDLANGVYYLDDATSHPLTTEQTGLLKGTADRWGVPGWEAYCQGEEQPTTGSFRWRLVFELEDGSRCAYGGYTGDMSHLPANFYDLNRELMGVIESAG